MSEQYKAEEDYLTLEEAQANALKMSPEELRQYQLEVEAQQLFTESKAVKNLVQNILNNIDLEQTSTSA